MIIGFWPCLDVGYYVISIRESIIKNKYLYFDMFLSYLYNFFCFYIYSLSQKNKAENRAVFKLLVN